MAVRLSAPRARAIVRLEGVSQLKNPVTSSGIELVTFKLVACASTNYATACPQFSPSCKIKITLVKINAVFSEVLRIDSN
jgi:hypothetical protein